MPKTLLTRPRSSYPTRVFLGALLGVFALAAPVDAKQEAAALPVEPSVLLQSTSDTTGDTELVDQLRQILKGYADAELFSGTVLVGQGDGVLFTGSAGYANHDWGIANGAETRFRLASITKQFTSMVIMQLVQEQKLELDSTLIEMLPDYTGEAGTKVTLRQLLNHTSGIPSYTDQPGFMQNHTRDPFGVDELVRDFCSEALLFEPGSRYAYNNSGYILLGAIIEAKTGMTYAEAVHARIFKPAGMKHSGYDRQDRIVLQRATGYSSVLGHYRPADYIDMSIPYAAGSLYSTVGDLWLWHRALAQNTLLEEEGKRLSFTPGLGNYGFGWAIEENAVTHGGGIFGFSTMILRWPDSGRCVIVLGNDDAAATGELAQDLARVLAGESVGVPQARPDLALARLVLEGDAVAGAEAGLALLANLAGSFRPEVIEGSIHRTAQGLWDLGVRDDALRLWKFNTKAHAESVPAWDQLARVLEELGRNEESIDALIQAMELDPSDLDRAARIDSLASKQ